MEQKVDIKENYIYELDDKLLEILLKDHSSNKNIIWATDNYSFRGKGYYPHDHIALKSITGRNGLVIKPRVKKSKKEQNKRIKDKAEVFTPSWICNIQNNSLNESWFERKNVFNKEIDETWEVNKDKITYPEGKTWQDYVKLKILEISCGEAPYLVSRYDTVSGEWLELNNRIGALDRKIRVVNENVDNEKDWHDWVIEAYKATFGYEWQGDSLLIARENLLFTFIDYYVDRFENYPIKEYLEEIAKILSWNIWQMDGLKYVIPDSCKPEPKMQLSFFEDDNAPQECPGCKKNNNSQHTGIYCKVMNWKTNRSIKFYRGEKKMKFDFVIGNPPYQDSTLGDNDGYAPPVYHKFMDESFKISDRVELITPARFLFNAGSTPKDWNKKMLSDEHFKVIKYIQKSCLIFPNTDIKGGVCITYRDVNKNFGKVGIFTSREELLQLAHKVTKSNFKSLSDIVYSAESVSFTEQMHKEHPEIEENHLLSKGHRYDLKSNVLEKLNNIVFFDKRPNDNQEYVQIYGRKNNERVYMWINSKYIKRNINFDKWKVFLPAANGSGAIGEVLSTPLVGTPLVGHTQTFLTIGCFDNKLEAENCLKYIKSKFARTMLGVLKITQANKKPTWAYVPLQDFTDKSDIDWTKSIHEIDLQLYKKYNLTDDEIKFIETNVEEMK